MSDSSRVLVHWRGRPGPHQRRSRDAAAWFDDKGLGLVEGGTSNVKRTLSGVLVATISIDGTFDPAVPEQQPHQVAPTARERSLADRDNQQGLKRVWATKLRATRMNFETKRQERRSVHENWRRVRWTLIELRGARNATTRLIKRHDRSAPPTRRVRVHLRCPRRSPGTRRASPARWGERTPRGCGTARSGPCRSGASCRPSAETAAHRAGP